MGVALVKDLAASCMKYCNILFKSFFLVTGPLWGHRTCKLETEKVHGFACP